MTIGQIFLKLYEYLPRQLVRGGRGHPPAYLTKEKKKIDAGASRSSENELLFHY